MGLFKYTFVHSDNTIMQTLSFSVVIFITTLFVQLAIIMAAFITIIRFPKWFLETIGAKGSNMIDESINKMEQHTERALMTTKMGHGIV